MPKLLGAVPNIIGRVAVAYRFGDNVWGCWPAHGTSAVARKTKSKFDPEAFLGKADGGVTISKYEKGQVVFAQGDPANSVFYIREGRVKIAVISEQGKEAVVAFLKAGDFIGEGCLTGRPRRISTARALENTRRILKILSPSCRS